MLHNDISSSLKGDRRRSNSAPFQGCREVPQWHTADILDYVLLKENAKSNRCNMTQAEVVFWALAKSSGFGEKCRRQYIIGKYIVDFFFRKSRLIVEIDGEYHQTEEQIMQDKSRQEWLEQQGYEVIRFTNEEIIGQTDVVFEKISEKVKTRL